MTRYALKEGWIALAIIGALALMLLFGKPARSQNCPPDAKSCKVLVVTPEQAEVMDQLISQTCISGPYAQIADLVKFYKDMLAKAPPGVVPAAVAQPPAPEQKK